MISFYFAFYSALQEATTSRHADKEVQLYVGGLFICDGVSERFRKAQENSHRYCIYAVCVTWHCMCAPSREKVPNGLSRCHTNKKKDGQVSRPSFFWYDINKKSKKSSYLKKTPIFLLVWQQLRLFGSYSGDEARIFAMLLSCFKHPILTTILYLTPSMVSPLRSIVYVAGKRLMGYIHVQAIQRSKSSDNYLISDLLQAPKAIFEFSL